MHAGRDGDRRPARRQFLEHLEVHDVGLAAATELLRVWQPEQAEFAHRGEQPLRVALLALVLVDDGSELVVGEVTSEFEQVLGFRRGKQAVDWHCGPHCSSLARVHWHAFIGTRSTLDSTCVLYAMLAGSGDIGPQRRE